MTQLHVRLVCGRGYVGVATPAAKREVELGKQTSPWKVVRTHCTEVPASITPMERQETH